MISSEGELVKLRNYQNKGGEVEDWLHSLEEQMKYSLKVVVRNSFIKYEQEDTKRRNWVLDFPLQIIITLDAVIWTKTTEENYLLGYDKNTDLEEWFEANVQMLEEIT